MRKREREVADAEYLKDCVLERLKAFQDGTQSLPVCAQDLWRVIDEVWERRGRLAGTAQGRFKAALEPTDSTTFQGVEILSLRCKMPQGSDGTPVYYIRIPAETAHEAEAALRQIAVVLEGELTDWSFNC